MNSCFATQFNVHISEQSDPWPHFAPIFLTFVFFFFLVARFTLKLMPTIRLLKFTSKLIATSHNRRPNSLFILWISWPWIAFFQQGGGERCIICHATRPPSRFMMDLKKLLPALGPFSSTSTPYVQIPCLIWYPWDATCETPVSVVIALFR